MTHHDIDAPTAPAGAVTAPDEDSVEDLAADIAREMAERGLTLAVAESLTGGQVAAHLARAEGASAWFRGGVVAYSSEVKRDVLGVPDGPVVTPEAAMAMADGVARLLGADIGVGVTGAGGPDPQDGREPGTVFIATSAPAGRDPRLHLFEGDPEEVCRASCAAALGAVLAAVRDTS